MSLMVKENTNNIPKLEAGTYQAVCCGVVDLGRQFSETWQKWQDKILLMFDVVGETVNVDGVDMPRRLSKQYTNSRNERSNFARDIKAWRKIGQADFAALNPAELINAGCQLSVVHETRDDKTFVNVDAIIGLPKGVTVQPMSEPVIYDADDHDETAFARLPEWVQNRIKQSEQWKAREMVALPFDETPDELLDPENGTFGGNELPF